MELTASINKTNTADAVLKKWQQLKPVVLLKNIFPGNKHSILPQQKKLRSRNKQKLYLKYRSSGKFSAFNKQGKQIGKQ